MEVPEQSMNNESYLHKKREELKEFFKDAKCSQEVINRTIENELKPLSDIKDRPYIAASWPGEVKTEYEVMSGQPFTKVDDKLLTKPMTEKQILEVLKDSPIILEKARQIQIITNSQSQNIGIPLDEINLKQIKEINDDKETAQDNDTELNKINYHNMHDLMKSVNEVKTKLEKSPLNTVEEDLEDDGTESDEREFEMIENIVSQYTEKSYETRFQETKDMLSNLADKYESDPKGETTKDIHNIREYNALAEASSYLDNSKQKTIIQEVSENYSINETINIPTKNVWAPKMNEVLYTLKQETNIESDTDIEESVSNNVETKLQDTKNILTNINSVLDNRNNLKEEKIKRFDEKMEETLQQALEDIYQSNNDNCANKQMEFNEMKMLARNIVEDADNLSTLIKEDITNKLNSMNELLNDVNTALENSKKSNAEYEKLKQGRGLVNNGNNVMETEVEVSNESTTCRVSDREIDDIHASIGKLNIELQNHEERINQSKERYIKRSQECKQFMTDVDNILEKSREILHPQTITKTLEEVKAETDNVVTSLCIKNEHEDKLTITDDSKEINVRKEAWDLDLPAHKVEQNTELELFKQQELARNKRINKLLYDIKDNMKDNQEVLRLANTLLRREENRKKVLEDSTSKSREIVCYDAIRDDKAKGDHALVEKCYSGDKPLIEEVNIEKDNAKALVVPALDKRTYSSPFR